MIGNENQIKLSDFNFPSYANSSIFPSIYSTYYFEVFIIFPVITAIKI